MNNNNNNNKMNTCNICLTDTYNITYKCNDCVDGCICWECHKDYCPSGFAYTSNKNQVKCPVCRQFQYKWVLQAILDEMVWNVRECGGLEGEHPVYLIIERNISNKYPHIRCDEEEILMWREDNRSLLKPEIY